jgi:hypothetical protein
VGDLIGLYEDQIVAVAVALLSARALTGAEVREVVMASARSVPSSRGHARVGADEPVARPDPEPSFAFVVADRSPHVRAAREADNHLPQDVGVPLVVVADRCLQIVIEAPRCDQMERLRDHRSIVARTGLRPHPTSCPGRGDVTRIATGRDSHLPPLVAAWILQPD